MAGQFSAFHRNLLLGVGILALASCGQVNDWDLRGYGNGFNTAGAAENATQNRPQPDSRGVISYPGYQVAVARRGDTVASIASRLGLSPGDLARYNAVGIDTHLREGEVIALPARIPEENGAGQPGSDGQIDISKLANGAIDRAQSGQPQPAQTSSAASAGTQPIRHKVKRGETAYTIARLYNVPVRSLADWNGLGPDLSVHEGQVLLIPPLDTSSNQGNQASAQAGADVTMPGQQSPAPEPPSAAKPLPAATPPAASAKTKLPASPDMSKQQTSASASAYMMPVDGKIIRPYVSPKHKAIDIAAAPGTPVRAAAAGRVFAVTKDTNGTPIIVIQHSDGVSTAYSNVTGIKVSKGDSVKRGQVIAAVPAGDPSFLRFLTLKGTATVDPMTILK